MCETSVTYKPLRTTIHDTKGNASSNSVHSKDGARAAGHQGAIALAAKGWRGNETAIAQQRKREQRAGHVQVGWGVGWGVGSRSVCVRPLKGGGGFYVHRRDGAWAQVIGMPEHCGRQVYGGGRGWRREIRHRTLVLRAYGLPKNALACSAPSDRGLRRAVCWWRAIAWTQGRVVGTRGRTLVGILADNQVIGTPHDSDVGVSVSGGGGNRVHHNGVHAEGQG